MLRYAANLALGFREYPFYERFQRAADLGFAAVEFMSPFTYDVEQVVAAVRSSGVKVVQFNFLDGDIASGDRGFASHPDKREQWRAEVLKALFPQEDPRKKKSSAFPVAALTAYAALEALARVRAGDRVLIHAAAGGVGLMAVDIARLHGATIFGTASAAKHDFLRERGVQYPIDYRQADFVREVLRLTDGVGVDIALDSIGGRSWLRSYRALAPAGRLVICGVTALAPGLRRSWWGLLKFALGVPWLALNPVRLANDTRGVLGVNLGRLWAHEALLRAWAEQVLAYQQAGHLRVHVDRVFPLEEAAAAHRYIQERRNVGKVVLRP